MKVEPGQRLRCKNEVVVVKDTFDTITGYAYRCAFDSGTLTTVPSFMVGTVWFPCDIDGEILPEFRDRAEGNEPMRDVCGVKIGRRTIKTADWTIPIGHIVTLFPGANFVSVIVREEDNRVYDLSPQDAKTVYEAISAAMEAYRD